MENSDWSYKSYYIKGVCAYTEDHVLIHKIFISQLPLSLSVYDIISYFSKYGTLEDINFIRRNNIIKWVFINFMHAPDAAMALWTASHQIKSTPIMIFAGDSWHQPTRHPIKARAFSDFKNLDSDCLQAILIKLNLRDQIRVVRNLSHARPLFEYLYKNEKILLLEKLNNLTLWDYYDFFNIVGYIFTRIEGELHPKYSNRILNLIQKRCVNISELFFVYSEFDAVNFKRLSNLSNIVDLRLIKCNLIDDYISELRELVNLKQLDLSHNYKLSGLHLSELSNTMEVITLNNCSKLEEKHIINLCKTLCNLKELSLKECYSALTDRHVLNEMKIKCNNLICIKITIGNDAEFELVAQLPHLKRLVVFTKPVDLTNYIRMLNNHKADQLEYLHFAVSNCLDERAAELISHLKALRTLVCPNNKYLNDRALSHFEKLTNLEEIVLDNCARVSNLAILRLVLACSKLKYVHLQNCSLISEQLILELIKQMQMQQQLEKDTEESNKRNQPICFLVRNSMISKYTEHLTEVENAQNMVRLYFESVPENVLKYDELDEYFPVNDFFSFDERLYLNNQ